MKPLNREPIPTELYRAFEKREHAEQFLAGSIRLSSMQGFADSEDPARQDAMEGRSTFSYPGTVRSVSWNLKRDLIEELPSRPGTIHGNGTNCTPCYICCFTVAAGPGHSSPAVKFGRFVVRISATAQFIEQIAEAAAARLDRLGPLECGRVAYEDLAVLDREPTAEDFIRLSCFTKPRRYQDELEYRILQRFQLHLLPRQAAGEEGKQDLPNSVTIQLGKPLDGAEMFEVSSAPAAAEK